MLLNGRRLLSRCRPLGCGPERWAGRAGLRTHDHVVCDESRRALATEDRKERQKLDWYCALDTRSNRRPFEKQFDGEQYGGMDLIVLGTSSGQPTRSRNQTAARGLSWLFDCGEGTQHQLMKSTLKPGLIERIFISHLHGDHIFGLPGLLCGLNYMSPQTAGEGIPLNVYGPEGLYDFLASVIGISGAKLKNTEVIVNEMTRPKGRERPIRHSVKTFGSNSLLRKNAIYPSKEDKNMWELVDFAGNRGDTALGRHKNRSMGQNRFKVNAVSIRHTVPCWGFVVEESMSYGTLDPDKAIELGLRPGAKFAKLKNGESVQTDEGVVVELE